MKRQQDKAKNTVTVLIHTENDCNFDEGEYTAHIQHVIGLLDISSEGGVDDISLIKEALVENIDSTMLPPEGTTKVILEEDGEWEDVFWHKYYKVMFCKPISV